MDPNELTPQTAPRDVNALAACTPYQLRRLAETHLAGLRNEQEKMAWFGLKTPESKAQYILELLKRWDQQNPGAHTNGVSAPAQAAPAMTREPVASAPAPAVQSMAPVMPSTNAAPQTNSAPAVAGAGPGFIPAVAPTAVAAATAAASDKPKTTRTPRTAAAEQPVDLGANVVNLLTRILDQQTKDSERYDALVKQVTSILEEAGSAKTGRVEALENNYLVLQKQVDALVTMAQSTNQVLVWTLMAVATSNPNASPLDVLRSAIGDSESFPALVAQARGKA